MSASAALHPIQFNHHAAGTPAPLMTQLGAQRPELTDGSGYNAAATWSTNATSKPPATP